MNETASVVSGCSWEHQDGTGGSNTIGTSGASIMRPRPVVKVLFSSEYKKVAAAWANVQCAAVPAVHFNIVVVDLLCIGVEEMRRCVRLL